MLFILAIEILATVVRNGEVIKGVNIGGIEVKPILYADDMTICVRNKESVERMKEIYTLLKKINGLQVNAEKTNIMKLGKNKDKSEKLSFGNVVKKIEILRDLTVFGKFIYYKHIH